MSNRLGEVKDSLVTSAKATTILMLVAIAAALALGSMAFIAYDLWASYAAWAQEMANQVNLPNKDILAMALTAMPTLVQLAFVACSVASLPFTSNKAFRTLYLASMLTDTVLDTVQLYSGTIESMMFSLFISCVIFLFLSEFLFIFSTSVLVSLLYRLKTESGLWEMAIDPETYQESKSSGVRRGKS
jgi:hypothetical protein